MRRRRAIWVGMMAAGLLHGPCGRAEVVVVARRDAKASPQAEVGVLRCWPAGASATNSTVTVQAPDGRVLGRQVVWWGAGEPLDLRFDCSADVREVTVRIRPATAGQGGDSATAWVGKAGVLLETRWWVSAAADTWTNALAQWNSATKVAGRSEAEQIFDGIHRHGPTANFIARYEGWFGVPAAGKYGFATISDDASFLLIDGKLVAEWPGWHGTDGGRHGQHNGWVQLNAGVHRIEYFNVQKDAGFQVAAAWRRPGTEVFEVMPPESFRPTARFEVASLTATDAVQATAAFRWRPEGHAIADAGTLVGMKFEAMGREDSDVYRWTFADGVVREGPSVVHVFCGASLSPVSLEVLRGGKRAGFLKQTVHVRPDWTRRAEFEDEVCKRLLAAMPDAVFGAMSSEGLSPWVAWAYQFDDAALLGRLAATCLARAKAMDAGGARALYLLGLHFQKPTLRRYEDARTVWRALLALKDAPAELRGRTAMHLGGLTLHGFGDSFGAEALFAVADGLLPEGDDRRLLDIYRGDLRVFQDRLEAAREFYLRAGTVVSPDNVHYEVRRAERLERARRFLAAGDCDDAERVLRELEWERPMERMGLETGMLLARAQQARGEKDFALQTVRRLRRVAAGEPRHSELLWLAARLLRDAGLQDEADAAVKELRRLFPYSAEAAQAGGDVRVTRPGTGSWAERASTLAQSKRWRWV